MLNIPFVPWILWEWKILKKMLTNPDEWVATVANPGSSIGLLLFVFLCAFSWGKHHLDMTYNVYLGYTTLEVNGTVAMYPMYLFFLWAHDQANFLGAVGASHPANLLQGGPRKTSYINMGCFMGSPYEWPKINGFARGYFTPVNGVIWPYFYSWWRGPPCTLLGSKGWTS